MLLAESRKRFQTPASAPMRIYRGVHRPDTFADYNCRCADTDSDRIG